MPAGASDERPPEDCDVADRNKLLKYRLKRSEWLDMTTVGDPHHAVWTQITSMLWNELGSVSV